jgi:N-acetylneuraminic acid mutarotase
MAALDGDVYLISGLEMQPGADGKPAPRYLADAYRFRRGAWEKLPDPPWSAIAAPSPAPVSGGRIHVLGGVDGRLVGQVPRDTRVPDHLLDFDPARHAWIERSDRWPASVVTAPAFQLGSAWWFVSGEIMAGVRTVQVWSWTPAGPPTRP